MSSLLLVTQYTLHPTESHNMWRTYTNLPSFRQSQCCGLKLRCNLDKDVFCLEPNRTWWQNSLGRVASPASLSANFLSVLFSSSAFSIYFSTSMSIVCRITHQHSRSCNGMGRNTNCHSHTLHTASGCHPHSYCLSHLLSNRLSRGIKSSLTHVKNHKTQVLVALRWYCSAGEMISSKRWYC